MEEGSFKYIRLAVLGMGFIGKVHAFACQSLPFFYERLPFGVKLACVYNRTMETALMAKQSYGFESVASSLEEVFQRDDIDAVSICLPNFQHKACVLAAIKKGWHIYCEKPLAANMAEADEIKSALSGYTGTHRVAFHNRFFACVLRAKEIIDAGRLGRILSFQVSYQHPGSASPDKRFDWKYEKAYACGGAFFDMGSHVMDMLYYLMGGFSGIFARMQIAHPVRVDNQGNPRTVEVEDAAYIVVRMQNGAEGTVQVTKIAAGTNDEFDVQIYGEQGAIKFNLMDPNWVWFYDNTLPDRALGGDKGFVKIESVQRYPSPGGSFPSSKLAGGWLRAHVHSMYDFFAAVNEGRGSSPDLCDGAYIQYVMEMAYASAKAQKWLEL